MEISHYGRNVLSSGGETSNFEAEMNGVAFAIMSDGIYQHKIPAIIRELSSNANDSHIEAGCETTPFIIQLPNRFDPNFTVEDTGIGLDDYGVRRVFAAYFKSSKTNNAMTKELTGGMGIGAKSMFSYSETFMIRARKDGVERRYAAYIGEDGFPQVNLLHEQKTNEPNGVKVQMPVQQSDFGKFERETAVIASMFKTRPIVQGGSGQFEFFDTTVYEQIEEKNFAVINRNSRSELYSGNTVYVLMGSVIYPLPSSIVSEFDDFLSTITDNDRKSILVPFDISELAPTASRESISMKKGAHDKIVARVNNAVEGEIAKIQEVVDKIPHPVQAVAFLYSQYGNRVITKSVFTFNGESINRVRLTELVVPYGGSGYVITPMTYSNGHRSRLESVFSMSSIAVAPGTLHAFYREPGDPKSAIGPLARKFCNQGRARDAKQYMVFKRELTEIHRKRIESYFGVKIKWISYSKLREIMPKDAVERQTRDIDRGVKKNDTIYCRVIKEDYDKPSPAHHHEIDFETTKYATFGDVAGIKPQTVARLYRVLGYKTQTGGDFAVVFLKRHAKNAKKLDELGIPHWNDLVKSLIDDDIKKAYEFERINNMYIEGIFDVPAVRWRFRDITTEMAYRFSTIYQAPAELIRVVQQQLKEVSDRFGTNRPITQELREYIRLYGTFSDNDFPLVTRCRAMFKATNKRYSVVNGVMDGLTQTDSKAMIRMVDFCNMNSFDPIEQTPFVAQTQKIVARAGVMSLA